MVPQDELELIERLKQGDEAAFRTLVERYQDLVYNTALGVVQNESDAEDVAQEVFIQVYRSIGSFKSEAKLSTWIYRITTTRALDLLRARKSKKRFGLLKRLWETAEESPMENIQDFNHPGVSLERKEEAAQLMTAIAQLPENQKVAFVLHKLEGLSYLEIAEVMGNTLPAVESLMHRARLNLRKILEKKISTP
ncbi:MAG: sigma-70 family RNA polymerase sigma factor [Bacteroidetes bacterium]|jgi:RNA polymerase sigma-70 factor (ECF subfamily)|nr:sigma-70 family RNA polymerase sigma factor [Bacteroidota bacterium]